MTRVALKNLLARKLRLALTSVAVILGVAFMAGTFVLTDTLGSVFDSLFATTTEGVDAVVRAREPFEAPSGPGQFGETRPPVPESLVDDVTDVPEVARAQGTIGGYALVIGKDHAAVQNSRGAPNFAVAWRSDSINRSLRLVQPDGEGRRSRGPRAVAAGELEEVAFDQLTFDESGYRIGDRVRIVFAGSVEPRSFRLTGVFRFGNESGGLAGATLAAFTPAVAQQVTGHVGEWSSVNVAATPGVSEIELRRALNRELRAQGQDGQYEAITGTQLAEESANQIKDNLSFFNIFLLVFALVSLFVGAFIIYNTFSITVAQRTRELGLLRALGASGRQVVGSVALEALVVGVFASVLGLVLGIAIVRPLEALMGVFGFKLPSGSLDIRTRTVVVSLLVGTIVTLVSALSPARRAASVSPVAALRDQSTSPSSGRRRYLWGGLATGIGGIALGYGLFVASGTDAAILIGGAAALVFIGVGMLSPLLARPAAVALCAPVVWRERVTGLLARENAARNPRRTASTAAALMIGLALVSLIAILGASTKDSFSAIIGDQTRGDFVLSSESFVGFSPQAAQRVRERLPGATVVEVRLGSASIAGDSVAVTGVPGNVERGLNVGLRRTARTEAFDRDGGVFVHAEEARALGYRVGDEIPAVFPRGDRALTVQGIFENRQIVGSDYLVSLADWDLFDQSLDQLAVVVKPAGTSTAQAQRIVEAVGREFPGLRTENKDEFRQSQLDQLDQILGLMYVLLLLAVVIALIGIANTLALSVFERTREIGLLRAVGMSRRQTSRMIRGEAWIVAAFGGTLGLLIGIVFGVALVSALADDDISLSIPPTQLAAFLVLSGLLGVIAGWWPARHAARLDVLRAVNSE